MAICHTYVCSMDGACIPGYCEGRYWTKAVYCMFMNKWADKPKKKWFYIIYALVANGVSFGVGMLVAQMLPGIF